MRMLGLVLAMLGVGSLWGQPVLIPVTHTAVAAAPYVAEIELVWDGADGTPAGTATMRQMRDGQGRQRLERTVNEAPQVTIVDVVAGRMYVLDSTRQTAREITITPIPADATGRKHLTGCDLRPGFTDAGTKRIAGLETCGQTREGLELWRSVAYDLPLALYRTDPRLGHLRERVVAFRAEEPDAALFRVPESYSVRKVEPRPDAAGLYRVGAGVSPPVVVKQVDPEFSDEARRQRISGSILLGLEVGEDGRPRNVKVVQGLGHGLDEKAVEAVSQYRFRPAMKDGQPVAVAMKIEVTFRIYTKQ